MILCQIREALYLWMKKTVKRPTQIKIDTVLITLLQESRTNFHVHRTSQLLENIADCGALLFIAGTPLLVQAIQLAFHFVTERIVATDDRERKGTTE